jgi:lysophospholipase L1-like esterase
MDSTIYEDLAQANLPAQLVTVLLGSNDAVGYFEPSPIEPLVYAGALNEIIDNLLFDGADQVLLMTPPPWGRHVNDAVGQRLADYRVFVQALCTHRDSVVCGPDLYTLLDLAEHFEGVNVHPNAAGHLVIAQELSASILAFVPEPSASSLILVTAIVFALRHRSHG